MSGEVGTPRFPSPGWAVSVWEAPEVSLGPIPLPQPNWQRPGPVCSEGPADLGSWALSVVPAAGQDRALPANAPPLLLRLPSPPCVQVGGGACASGMKVPTCLPGQQALHSYEVSPVRASRPHPACPLGIRRCPGPSVCSRFWSAGQSGGRRCGPLLRDGETEALLRHKRQSWALRAASWPQTAPADAGDPPLLPAGGRVPCPAPCSRLSVWPLHSLSLRHC